MREANTMTEAEVRAALAAFDAIGGMERWIAAQPWLAMLGGWVVPEPFEGWRLNLEITYGGPRIVVSGGWGEPAVWVVPAGRAG